MPEPPSEGMSLEESKRLSTEYAEKFRDLANEMLDLGLLPTRAWGCYQVDLEDPSRSFVVSICVDHSVAIDEHNGTPYSLKTCRAPADEPPFPL